MKQIFFTLILVSALTLSCSHTDSRYIDLKTGKTVKLEKNAAGLMINTETKQPVEIYIDTQNHDTIYGRTGKVINGHIVKNGNDYSYDDDIKVKIDDDGEYKIKDGDYKMKVESDGDIKIKNGEKKTKIDGETGEKKNERIGTLNPTLR